MGHGMARTAYLAGVAFGCCLVLLLLKAAKKGGSIKCKYDERQQLVRGRGFKYGFFGWMAFNGIYIFMDIGLEVQCMDTSMVLLSGMLVGVMVYASYCIWNDGYFSLNENPKRAMAILAAASLLNIACAAYRIQEGLLENGVLTFLNGSNLSVAALSVILLAVLFVKWGSDHRKPD